MLCENCYENRANIHITKIVNGKKVEKNLCYSCSKNNRGMEEKVIKHFDALQFNEYSSKLLDHLGGTRYNYARDKNMKKCETCGTSLIQFKESGLLGCEECYRVFHENIKNAFKIIEKNHDYRGKIPKDMCDKLKLKDELKKLKKELHVAIEQEKYEDAANLRDEIRKIESKIGDQKYELD